MTDSDSNPPSHAPSPSPQTPDSDTTFCVSSQVTCHISVLAPKGSRAKPKVKKEVKMKEFTHQFCVTLECYLLLLKMILSKHGQDKYKVTAWKCYGIKILCSPSCVYAQVYIDAEPKLITQILRKSDAININIIDEYKVSLLWTKFLSFRDRGEDLLLQLTFVSISLWTDAELLVLHHSDMDLIDVKGVHSSVSDRIQSSDVLWVWHCYSANLRRGFLMLGSSE